MSAPTDSFEMNSLDGKTSPVNNDTVLLKDSADSNQLKEVTFLNLLVAILSGAIQSINGDSTNAQIIAAGVGLDIVDAGEIHTFAIDATVATLLGAQSLENKTLITPVIASFLNAQHNHQAASGGGVLEKLALPTVTVYEDEANTWGAINQNIAATGKWQEGGVNISPIGLHDQYLDAGGFIPVDTEPLITRLIGTFGNQKAVAVIPFLTNNDTFAVLKMKLPRTYNLGTLTAIINWTSQVEGVGDVIWGISGVAVADGDDLAAAATNYGTEVLVMDTQSTIDFSQDTPRTSAITLANVPTNADTIYLKVQRRGADPGDTFTQAAQLLGIWFDLTTDAAVSGP